MSVRPSDHIITTDESQNPSLGLNPDLEAGNITLQHTAQTTKKPYKVK